jgi:hypothetical protein
MKINLNILDQFIPISLSEMDRVKLMNRIDTKFAFRTGLLENLLDELKSEYKILEINTIRIPKYESLYFDDEKFSFFQDHHKGKTNRFKVRIRKYVESNLLFLEIKHRFKGRTDKKRIETTDFTPIFEEKQQLFVDKQLKKSMSLNPSIWNSFQRITLVHNVLNERLTLDFNIEFKFGEISCPFPNLVISELKQEKLNRSSPFFKIMKSKSIRSYRLSKYCLGSIELYGEGKLKFNRFKRKLLYLKKMNNDTTI